MIETLIAAVAGASFMAVAMGGRRLFRKAKVVIQETEFPGWVEDEPLTEAHEHQGHIAGTSVRGGVKHKRMQCGLCPKKWSEPC